MPLSATHRVAQVLHRGDKTQYDTFAKAMKAAGLLKNSQPDDFAKKLKKADELGIKKVAKDSGKKGSKKKEKADEDLKLVRDSNIPLMTAMGWKGDQIMEMAMESAKMQRKDNPTKFKEKAEEWKKNPPKTDKEIE